ncbi:MAG: hypothetical protein KDC54_07410 [Lewinella sp.]|nr:hypothetical protein [Lewinella sp.]
MDLTYLRKMAGGDAATEALLLRMLAEELERDLPRVRQLCHGQQWSELTKLCNHLKSTLLFSGDRILTEANNQLLDYAEKKGQSGLLVEPCLLMIERNGERVLTHVRQLLAKR